MRALGDRVRAAGSGRAAAGLRALVVEHESDRCDLVMAVLAVLGFEARAVGDASAALDVLARWRADLVVLDLGLPRVNGWALRGALRTLPAARDAAVVVLPPIEPGDGSGPSRVLPRAFSVDGFLRAVARRCPAAARATPAADEDPAR